MEFDQLLGGYFQVKCVQEVEEELYTVCYVGSTLIPEAVLHEGI